MRVTHSAFRGRDHGKLFVTVCSLALMMGAFPAAAQTADTAKVGESQETIGLGEITVTARRIEESLNTVPLAISAFGTADIQNRDLRNLDDVSRSTSSFQFTNQVGGGSGRNDRSVTTNLTFRGLYIPEIRGVATGGGVFVNGAPVIGSGGPAMAEIERIEVLKGPQSVYFGRATFAGAINYVTKAPDYEWGGKVEAKIGDYGTYMFGASLNVPIVQDVLAVRVGAQRDYLGGQYTNYGDSDQTFGNQETTSVNAEVLFEPASNFKVRGLVSYNVIDDGAPVTAALKQDELNCDRGGSRGKWYCGALPGKIPSSLISGNYALTPEVRDTLINNSNGFYTLLPSDFSDHAGMHREQLQLHLHMDWELGGGFQLSSITAWHSDKSAVIADAGQRDRRNDPNPNFGIAALPNAPENLVFMLHLQSKSRDFSQELRLTSPQDKDLRFVAGASYFEATLLTNVVFGHTPYGPMYVAPLTKTFPKTPAVFGGVYYDLLPDLTLSAEGRMQWDKVQQVLVVSAAGAIQDQSPYSKTFQSFSPRITLDWNFAPNSTAYALWSRGTRPGGFNTQVPSLAPDELAQIVQLSGFTPGISYGEEKLNNFEAGIKHRFWDNRANISLTAYMQKLRNGQNVTNTWYNNTTTGAPLSLAYTVNAGAIDLKGIEFEGQVTPFDGFVLGGMFALNDTKIKNYICTDCTAIIAPEAGEDVPSVQGNRLFGAPKYSWNVNATYEHDLTADYQGFVRVDYRHKGSYYLDLANLARTQNDDQVDIRFGVKSDSIRIEAFVQNLFDERTAYGQMMSDVYSTINRNGASTSPNEIRLALPEKRRMGIRASYNF